MAEAVIVSAVRSPIGRAHKGGVGQLRADELAAAMVRAALAEAPGVAPADIDDLILGCAAPGGEQGFNMGRVVAVLCGMDTVPGTTITRYCASSLQAARMAFHTIKSDEGHCVVAAGTEVVSRYGPGHSDSLPGTTNPVFDAPHERSEAKINAQDFGWSDPRDGGNMPDMLIPMIQTAEYVAALHGITRQAQDEWAVTSQNRTERAADAGILAREITPITLPDATIASADESPRGGVQLEGVANLKPIFAGGTITAGNACPLNDGAAALVIMSRQRADSFGLKPLARIVSSGVSALAPELMGLGPVESSRRALDLAGMTIGDIDYVEMNEAFAAQVLPSANQLGINADRLNVHGGAIALGHPFGMTGIRLIVTLLNTLCTHDASTGLVTLCVGGGQGMAMILERLN